MVGECTRNHWEGKIASLAIIAISPRSAASWLILLKVEKVCIYKQLVGGIFCIYERHRKTSGPFLSQAAKFSNQPNSNIDTTATIFEEMQFLEKKLCRTSRVIDDDMAKKEANPILKP